MKYLLEADRFSSPESSEERTLPAGATIFRGRCYIEVDAESRHAAFAAAKAANINGVKEWGILAEGQDDIDKVKPHLSTNAIYSALIRSARLALGLTQQQLGEHLGYTGENAQRYVYDWEAGRRMVPRDKLQKLAELLRLDPMQLL